MQFINYWDVWGNENDGWDVNDVSRHNIYGDTPDTPEQILELLKFNDIVHANVSLADIEIEFHEFSVELTERANGRPFGRIEF